MVYAFTAASDGRAEKGTRAQKIEGSFFRQESVLWARFVCYGRFLSLANHKCSLPAQHLTLLHCKNWTVRKTLNRDARSVKVRRLSSDLILR